MNVDFNLENLYNSTKVITFDFDGTLNNSYYRDGKFVEDLTPKQEFVEKLKDFKSYNFVVYIVTARRECDADIVTKFVNDNELDVDGVYLTNGNLKGELLMILNSILHFDDSQKEVDNNLMLGINTYHVKV